LPGTDLPDQELPPEPDAPQIPSVLLPEPEPEPAPEPEYEIYIDENGDVVFVELEPLEEYIVEHTPPPAALTIVEAEVPLGSPYQSTADVAPGVDYGYAEGALNNEEYAKPDEQGFFDTATNPLSTFSADVDTASYSNLRRIINEGGVLSQIPAGAVRIEEMLNYFNYDFIMPEEGKPFALNAQVADCPWNPDSRLMILGLQAQGLRDGYLGSNLVFLIDVSGSMSAPNKMELLKPAFCFLADQLTEHDTISIVTYANGVDTVLSGVNGSETQRIKDAINGLNTNGGTNGSDGILRAYALAEEHFQEGGNNRIILASDGDMNVGVTSVDDLHDLVTYKRHTGVYLSVLGFGAGNYKDDKMETLAHHGNGNYFYIDSLDEAKKVLGTDLMANMVSVADDVKLQVEFNPDVIESYRLIGYDNRRLNDEDFLDDTKDAAEMGAGHQMIVAYEIIMKEKPEATEEEGTEEDVVEDEIIEDEIVEDGVIEENALEDTALEDETTEEDVVENDAVEEAASEEELEGLDDDEAILEADSSDALDVNQWCTVSLRYKVPGEPVSKGIQFVVDDSVYTDDPDKDWVFISGVIEAGLILSQSAYIGSSTLKEALQLVKIAEQAAATSCPYRVEFAELLTKLIKNS